MMRNWKGGLLLLLGSVPVVLFLFWVSPRAKSGLDERVQVTIEDFSEP